MKVAIEIDGPRVYIYRERGLTMAERKKYPEMKLMVETVKLAFGNGEPEVGVSRYPCGR